MEQGPPAPGSLSIAEGQGWACWQRLQVNSPLKAPHPAGAHVKQELACRALQYQALIVAGYVTLHQARIIGPA